MLRVPTPSSPSGPPERRNVRGPGDRSDGRMRLFELVAVLGWEKSRLSHHVARMAARGLVTEEKCDTDRRGAFVAVPSS